VGRVLTAGKCAHDCCICGLTVQYNRGGKTGEGQAVVGQAGPFATDKQRPAEPASARPSIPN